jgi:hypothetical protein
MLSLVNCSPLNISLADILENVKSFYPIDIYKICGIISLLNNVLYSKETVVSNKHWLIAVKVVAAIFNFPATAFVFHDIFSQTGRSQELVLFNTLCAVLLIDVLFLWVLGVLEDSSLEPVKRIPVAFSSILLIIATIWIGFKDEGVLAFAPRIGLVILVFNDLILWGTDYWQTYYSREKIEQRIRDKEVIHSREIKAEASREALENLYEELVISQENRLIKQLGLNDPIEETKQEPQNLELFAEDDLDKYVTKNGKGFVWENPYTGEMNHKTATGKYYTEKGAKLALRRVVKQNEYALQED